MSRPFRCVRRVLPGALFIACALRAPLPAQEHPVAAWEQRLAQADQQLRQGDYKKARRNLRELVALMGETLGTGPVATQLLGRTTGGLALAEAGLDEMEAARWDWDVARLLSPTVAALDLAAYGDAGRRLADSPAAGVTSPAVESGTTPPARKKGKPIEYPISRLIACPETPVEVAVTVSAEGKPRQPRLDPAQDAVLARAALETLRGWTFEPATRGGRPVDATFTLRTDLTAKRCRDLMATRKPIRTAPDTAIESEE